LLALACACAPAPARSEDLTPDDLAMARAVAYATRVPPPAREYRVAVPSRPNAEPILAAAATAAGLTVERPGVLRRTTGGELVPVVLLTIQGVTSEDDRDSTVDFSYAIDSGTAVPCRVVIRRDGTDKPGWAFRSLGEEHCWPRPSRRK
jgi:hypothetical protein